MGLVVVGQLAARLGADRCQIFTDVYGVHTCDPGVVPDASKIDEIAYDELLEMAGAGGLLPQLKQRLEKR